MDDEIKNYLENELIEMPEDFPVNDLNNSSNLKSLESQAPKEK